MHDMELEAIISYLDSDTSKKDRQLRDDLKYIIDGLTQIYEYAETADIPNSALKLLINDYTGVLKECEESIKHNALDYFRRKKIRERIIAKLDESSDDPESSYSECDNDCCDCRTCRYYEEGPIQWGFADGEQIFGEGMCHADDRRIVGKATGHKPCHSWKSVNDTSPDIDYP